MTGRVAGKVAIITGGASGIGAETARRLAREGASVVLADLDAEAGEAVAAEIAAQGHTAAFIAHDVTSEAAWASLMQTAVARFGRLDVLVNCAGISGDRPLLKGRYDVWKRIMAVNLDGAYLGLAAAAPIMVKAGSGSIVNISSLAGKVGIAGAPAYCASKGGVALLTKAAALELAPHGVRVNSVHPGFIATPMVENSLARDPNGETRRAAQAARHPLGRYGQPREIADGIVFLASDESSFMTGSELVIDGGYTAV